MKTFCITFKADKNDTVLLEGAYANYMKNVMRFAVGHQVVLFNTDDKKRYSAKIDAFLKQGVSLKIIEKIEDECTLDTEIILAFALLKGANTELILKRATEVGVKGFIPFVSERTVVKPSDNKRTRWEKIIMSAVEQSGSHDIPFISDAVSFKDVLNDTAMYDIVLSGDAQLSSKPLYELDLNDKKRVLLIIGPEGGFADAENEILKEVSVPFSFGDNVLRAETAGIVLPAVILNEIKRQKNK